MELVFWSEFGHFIAPAVYVDWADSEHLILKFSSQDIPRPEGPALYLLVFTIFFLSIVQRQVYRIYPIVGSIKSVFGLLEFHHRLIKPRIRVGGLSFLSNI